MNGLAFGNRDALRRERVKDAPWIRMFRNDALSEQGNKCAFCHEPIKRVEATADHLKAYYRGGSTKRENIKAACLACNLTKGSRGEAAFLRAIKNPQPGDSLHIWSA